MSEEVQAVMRTVLSAAVVVVLAASLACTGKKETPGVVGNQYPHEALDVTGSPYQSYDELSNRQGVLRDTPQVRGPSLLPAPAIDTAQPSTDSAQPATEGGVERGIEGNSDTTRGGTTQ